MQSSIAPARRPLGFTLLALLFGWYAIGCTMFALLAWRTWPPLAVVAGAFALVAGGTAHALWIVRPSVPRWIVGAGVAGLLFFTGLFSFLQSRLPASQLRDARIATVNGAVLWVLFMALCAWLARRRLRRSVVSRPLTDHPA